MMLRYILLTSFVSLLNLFAVHKAAAAAAADEAADVAAVNAADASANAVRAAVGELSLQVVGSRSWAGPANYVCPGVLIAPDVVLAPAHCYDWLRVFPEQDPIQFISTFKLRDADGAVQTRKVRAWEAHPDYTWLSCADTAYRNVCAQARAYCGRRHHIWYQWRQRADCSTYGYFYAKTYLDRPAKDLALIYLDEAVPNTITPMAIAAPAANWAAAGGLLAIRETLTAPAAAPSTPLMLPLFGLTHQGSDLLTASLHDDGDVALAWTDSMAVGGGRPAMVALPAHWASPPEADAYRGTERFLYSRVDTEIAWIRSRLDIACHNGERSSAACEAPVVLPLPGEVGALPPSETAPGGPEATPASQASDGPNVTPAAEPPTPSPASDTPDGAGAAPQPEAAAQKPGAGGEAAVPSDAPVADRATPRPAESVAPPSGGCQSAPAGGAALWALAALCCRRLRLRLGS